jgi:hypothetical protein
MIPPFPLRSAARSGDSPETPGPDAGAGIVIRVRASSQPYYAASNPVPASYAEPAGNQWARLRIGINGTKVGSPLFADGDYYATPPAYVDLDFATDTQRGLIQSVQVHFDNDWGSPTWTGAPYTDRNAVLDTIIIDIDGTPVTLNATDAVYVRVSPTGNTEVAATNVGAIAGYWDFRNLGSILGNGTVSGTSVLTRSGNNFLWRGGTTKLWGANFRVWAPFDTDGAPAFRTAARDHVLAQPQLMKGLYAANAVRMNMSAGEYRFWRDEGSLWPFLDSAIDACYNAGLFVELNWWVVGAPGLPYADDDSWAHPDYQPFYDTDKALCEEFWEAAAARYKDRGYVVFSLWDEPIRQPMTTGTLAAGSTTTATLPGGSSSVTDYHKGRRIYFQSGTGSGQDVLISAYNGTTKVATLASTLATGVNNTTTFTISDTWAYIQPFMQGLVDIIRGEGAPNLISIPGMHYARDVQEILTSHPITDALENWAVRYHEFSSGELANFLQFITSGGTRVDSVRPLIIGGTGYAPETASAPSGDYATWLSTYAFNAKAFYLWDWSKFNSPPALATGYPVRQDTGTTFTAMGQYFRARPIAPRLTPQSGANPTSPGTSTTAWTPARRQSQLVFRYQLADTAEVTKNGSDELSAANDSGPSNFDLAATGAPVWGATSFGGTPGVSFDGVDDRLRGATRVVGTACTFVIAYKWVSGGPVYGRAMGIQKASTGDDFGAASDAAVWYSNNNTGLTAQRATTIATAASYDTTNCNLVIIRFTGSQVRVRLNGTNLADVTQTGAFDSNFLTLGGSYATSNFGKVILAEAYAYNFALSDTECEFDEGYLAHEHTALLARIGSGHPYYAAAPTVSTGGGTTTPPTTPPTTPTPYTNIHLRERSRIPLRYLPSWCPDEGHFTKDVVVSVSGNDSNSGSDASPVRTIGRALARATELGRAGTQILLKPDQIYRATNVRGDTIGISSGGNGSNWFAIRGYPGMARPIVQMGPSWSAMLITTNYFMIDGVEFDGTRVGFQMENGQVITSEDQFTSFGNANNANQWGSLNGDGIFADARGVGGAHHCLIYDCVTRNFPGSGIQSAYYDYLIGQSNLTFNNARFSRYGKSGISFFEGKNYTGGSSGDTTRTYIMWNVAYNNQQLFPSTFINNNTITDGNAYTVDRMNATGYSYRTLVGGNLGFDCGGAGIVITGSDNVDMINNTFYGNNKVRLGGGEIYFVSGPVLGSSGRGSLGGKVFSNICYSTLNSGVLNYFQGSSGTSGNNILFSSAGGANNLQSSDRNNNPAFVQAVRDPGAADFRVRVNSPAVGLSNATNVLARDILGNAASGTPPAGCFFIPA